MILPKDYHAAREALDQERAAKEGGHTTLGECQICGWRRFVSRQPTDPPGLTILPLMAPCEPCNAVRQRNPEVYQWVLNVLLKDHLDREDKAAQGR